MTRRRKEPGQRIKGNKWEVFVRVNGVLRSKRFDMATPLDVRRKWRDDQIADSSAPLQVAAAAGSFAAFVDRYLNKPEIAARRFVKQYAAHLQLWIAALGAQRSPSSITRDDVEGVLQTWLRTLAQPTVYHRRSTLRSLFVTMTGSAGPVEGTTVPDHERPIDRSMSFQTAERIVDAMPDWAYRSAGIQEPSLAKLCARVTLHTGIPPAELRKIKHAYLDRVARTLRMPWRDKGKSVAGHVRQLSDVAVAALGALDDALKDHTKVWGDQLPPAETVSHSFKRTARRILGPGTDVRFYDLRHTLGADTYRFTKDLDTVARMLGHAPGSKVTTRYAMGAHADVDRAAADLVAMKRATPASATDAATVGKAEIAVGKLGSANFRRRKLRVVNTLRRA